MSDGADRPLKRRERRLREMAEAEGLPPAGDSAQAVQASHQGGSPAASEPLPEISPFNDDGTPRSRREMRELRDQALAAQREASGGDSTEPGHEAVSEDDQTTGEAEDHGLDPHLEATQPYSREDLELIAQDQAVAEAAQAEAAAETVEAGEPLADQNESAHDSEADVETAAVADGVMPDETTVIEVTDAETTAIDTTVIDDEAKAGYSFPDIVPLEESVSVFDDPTTQVAPAGEEGAGSGEFDDLISRAVAQEGAAASTNSAALILPTLPEGADLSGPLGDTGELFITGSLELPKELGETGSHTPLREVVEPDHLEELGLDEIPTSDDVNSPVSATRAVSAVRGSERVVAQETKEKSKLPLALILTGGGMVVAVGALLVWGASAGMFG